MTAPMAPPFPGSGRGVAAPPPLPALGPFAQYSPYAWLLDPALWALPKRWFIYTVDFVDANNLAVAGAAGATRTRPMAISNDAGFVPVYGVATVTNTDNVTFVDSPAILVQINDTGATYQFMDAATAFLNVWGRGAVGDGRFSPVSLPPYLKPATTLTFTLQNLDATARHVRLAYHGFKVVGAPRANI